MDWIAPLFVVALVVGSLLRLWLSARQIAAVSAHREHVPEPFADTIPLADHQKAADYTIAKVRLSRLAVVLEAAVALALTLGGGIATLDALWARAGWAQPWHGGAVILTVLCVVWLVELPLTLWSTFVLEARFGFNRMTPGLFVADLAKSALLAVLIGGPVVLGALYLMQHAGTLWWIWAWCGWLALTLLMTWAWPAFIAPLFNRFVPLEDGELKGRIESLLERCGFRSQGVFVVDGSRRSAHGNAYFTGIGRHKRIVFFDTLMARLAHAEIEAVLAHELGHFRLGHVRLRLALMVVVSFVGLALLGWLAASPAFYTSLGVPHASTHAALLLFVYVTPAFMFFLTPLGALWSRGHEFAADEFAMRNANATELASALVKLYRDNASTLTPDRVYSGFYYSHPPALERIGRLRQAGALDAPATPRAAPV